MSQTLRKRGRDTEALPVSTDVRGVKRFHGEETDRFCHLLQLDKTLSQEEEECVASEEVISEVMKSLEEEIDTICFTSYPSSNSGDTPTSSDTICFTSYPSSNSGDTPTSSDISSSQEGETQASDSGDDLFYLLEASDDELGIPLSPVLDLKNEVCQFPKVTSEGLLENPDFKSLGEIWDFEDDFENFQQFALYEDPCEASELQDYMNRDFVSQDMFSDGDFSAAWTLETAACL